MNDRLHSGVRFNWVNKDVIQVFGFFSSLTAIAATIYTKRAVAHLISPRLVWTEYAVKRPSLPRLWPIIQNSVTYFVLIGRNHSKLCHFTTHSDEMRWVNAPLYRKIFSSGVEAETWMEYVQCQAPAFSASPPSLCSWDLQRSPQTPETCSRCLWQTHTSYILDTMQQDASHTVWNSPRFLSRNLAISAECFRCLLKMYSAC